MLPPVVSHEAFCDGLVAGANSRITELGQRVYVSIAVEDRIKNRQSCRSGDIADDMVKLQVHLIERFLHVLDMTGCQIDQACPMSQQRPESTNALRRAEGGT